MSTTFLTVGAFLHLYLLVHNGLSFIFQRSIFFQNIVLLENPRSNKFSNNFEAVKSGPLTTHRMMRGCWQKGTYAKDFARQTGSNGRKFPCHLSVSPWERPKFITPIAVFRVHLCVYILRWFRNSSAVRLRLIESPRDTACA